jgi:catechol 2,3-dioxygenase-like lactoylglutathione lyase family enzyme
MRIAVTLPASDLERAKAWYSRILGLEPVEVEPMGETWYELGGYRFMLYESQFAGTNKATAAGLEVDDFEATVAELKARGATFEEYDFGEDFRTVEGIITLPNGRKGAWLKDSEGNILGIAQAKA